MRIPSKIIYYFILEHAIFSYDNTKDKRSNFEHESVEMNAMIMLPKHSLKAKKTN